MHVDKNLAAAYEHVRDREHVAASMGDSTARISEDNATFMFIGTGVDCLEVMFIANRAALAAIGSMISDNVSMPSALEAQYIEGFLVGMELAKVQQEERAHEDNRGRF